jgi:hypothetical protein
MDRLPASKLHIEETHESGGRYLARKEMEAAGYNPIRRLMEIDVASQVQEEPDLKLQTQIALKLLEYYVEKPASTLNVSSRSQHQHILIKPAEFMDPNHIGTVEASQPPVLDIFNDPTPGEGDEDIVDAEFSSPEEGQE